MASPPPPPVKCQKNYASAAEVTISQFEQEHDKKERVIFRRLARATTTAAASNKGSSSAATTTNVEPAKKVRTNPDHVFPNSKFLSEGNVLSYGSELRNPEFDNRISRYFIMRGAKEDGCVHCIHEIGVQMLERIQIQSAQPWFLEGAIHGSIRCTDQLVNMYNKASPCVPEALKSYWMKVIIEYQESSGMFDRISTTKDHINNINRHCSSCWKVETKSLTLKQCMGCSTCCYCSPECQQQQWLSSHKGECNQVLILNKYHKPYAKEIREAAIRGKTHHALEKLRHKLSLTRPTEEYIEKDENLYDYRKNSGLVTTDSGTPYNIIYQNFNLGARDDGTVWNGSTPAMIGRPSSFDITTLDKLKLLFEQFDLDQDGYLNYDESAALQKATGDDNHAPPLSMETYVMVCQSLNCIPDTGLSVGRLKCVYASESADIDVDYDKVFKKELKPRRIVKARRPR
mmetsp:Transcript_8750/g.10274  ORF Transcript_8750/g.10274 Transcript_8750/m.10274 type:complete len:458 (-) Transcript_8750:90-1463(-)|eukprot:CAMPEP_0170859240 /NCGR_PEP_ID=MMETSP0734-20130129/16605_1 /TAXON_ID=186038 /ORGANISM="Fragilariopsis kerguelensis, Strain L26-C5" /LENGTH=457 /DNA_ID=CAMNT_0011232301 /DNA_START=339 /DNA_END=1712 /DNA_ORIENTATION=-